ncbi:MAG TPA: redoxin domain-containing protein [Thermoanaerobaculia bacterium]|jgi:cytochrome c biogenesis protein CcmG/thiol:disulfide interchange protein DsbE
MNRTVLVVGSAITLALVAVLFLSLGNDPSHIDSPLIGRPAPPFALKAVNSGEMIDVTRLRGKPVVLNFWATWCVPCYQEHPVLVENAQRIGSNAQFVGVVFNDSEDKINAFLRQRGSAYPTLLDEQGKTAIAYGVGGVPETYFINPKGVIVAKFAGPMTTEVLQANLSKAMQ